MKPKRGDEKNKNTELDESNIIFTCLYSIAAFGLSAAISPFIGGAIYEWRPPSYNVAEAGLVLLFTLPVTMMISGVIGLIIFFYLAKTGFNFLQRLLFGLLIISSCNFVFFLFWI